MVAIYGHRSIGFRQFNHFSSFYRPLTATVISRANLCRLVCPPSNQALTRSLPGDYLPLTSVAHSRDILNPWWVHEPQIPRKGVRTMTGWFAAHPHLNIFERFCQ